MPEKQTMTKEQVQEFVKNNPDFVKELEKQQREQDMVLSSDPANDTKIYFDLATARAELGFVTLGDPPGEKIDTKDNKMISSGTIEAPEFIQMCGKEKALIKFGPELTVGTDIGELKNDFSYDEIDAGDCEIVRINIAIKKGDEPIKTVTHLEKKSFASIGKNHMLATAKVSSSSENNLPEDYTVVVDVKNTEEKTHITTCVIGDEKLPEGTKLYYIPLLLPKTTFSGVNDIVNKTFEEKKDEIISKFMPEEKLDEAHEKDLKDFVIKQLYENEYVNKHKLVKDFNENKIGKIKECLEENSGNIDYLNCLGYLFPKYGQENVDISAMEVDELGLPIISAKDKANIKVLGISKEIIDEMITQSRQTVGTAIDAINIAEKELEENKEKVYDAKCNLSVGINEKDWINCILENAMDFCNETNLNNEIEESKKFITATKMQIGGFKKLADRIQAKINGGEFANAYLLSCIALFWKMVSKRLGENYDYEQYSILPAFYKLINFYYLDGIDSKEMNDRKNKTFDDTCYCNIGVKDSYGNECRTVASLLDTYSANFVDISNFPEGLNEEQEADEILMRATARYEFIRALAIAPYQLVCRIYPEIASATIGKEITEEQKAVAEKYRNELGFKDIDNDKFKDKVDKIVNLIKNARGVIDSNKVWDFGLKASKNANEFAKKMSTGKYKNRLKKLGAFMRSIVVLDNNKYIDVFATRCTTLDSIEEIKKLADNKEEQANIIVHNIDETKEDITFEMWDALSDEDKMNYVLLKRVSDEKLVDMYMDFLVKNSLMSAFCVVLYKFFNDYDDAAGKENIESSRMFASTLGLIVPSLQILETFNISTFENPESFDPMAIVEGDKKAKLGTQAIKESIKGIKTIDDVYSARKEYVMECLKFVEISIS